MRMEVRSNSVVLDGYINAVGRDSRVLRTPGRNFVEQVEPGVFQRALEENSSIKFLYNHNNSRCLGATDTGEITLKEDAIGLRAHATIKDPEVVQRAKENGLKGWSFGFRTLKDEWEPYKEGIERRYLKEIELLEISVLSITPAYYGTSIEARQDGFFNEVRKADFDEISILAENEEVKEVRNLEKEIEILKLKGGV